MAGRDAFGDGAVVVTGASAGVGRAAVREFARDGARIALLARGSDGLAAAAREVEELGGTALSVPVDVSDPDQVEEAAGRVENELGPIRVWVNAAFASVFAPFTRLTSDEVRRVTEVCYLGYVHGTQAALSRMRPRDEGVIVQVGSALAYRSVPLQAAYCAAKHAVQGMHDSLRCELMHEGSNVRVTMVQLPGVNTPQFSWVRSRLPHRAQPVPPIYMPEVAGRAVRYAAAHPRRREYWVGGSTVATLIANRIAPGLLDRYLARTGYASQQTSEPEDPERPDNLWRPLDEDAYGDQGAHGDFDPDAHPRSPQLWLSEHRAAVGVTAAATALATVTALRRRRR